MVPSSATMAVRVRTSDQPASRKPRNSVEARPAAMENASGSQRTCAGSQRTPSRNQPTPRVVATLTVASANLTSDLPAR